MFDLISQLSDEQRDVLMVIHKHDKYNKIKDFEIRRLVQVEDPDFKKEGAGLRKVINSLRQHGFAICSDTHGYWYARSQQEILDNIKALRGRANKILEAADGLKVAAARFN